MSGLRCVAELAGSEVEEGVVRLILELEEGEFGVQDGVQDGVEDGVAEIADCPGFRSA